MEDEKDRLDTLAKADFEDARKSAGTMPKAFFRLRRCEEELGKLFLRASRNEVSRKDLEEQAGLLQESYSKFDEFDEISDELLDDCFAYVDELHDSLMESFPEDWRQGFDSYAKALLGRSERVYYYRPCPGVSVKVTYERKEG